jgi:proline racemase
VLLETGMLPVTEPVTRLVLETPAGLVSVEADVAQGRVERVTFRNVPAFACYLDRHIDGPGVGRVTVDVAWGGMFYVLCDATSVGVELEPDNAARIVQVTERIKLAAREQLPVSHPDNPGLNSITIGQLYAPARNGRRRNAVTVSTGKPDPRRPETFTGAIDRSPCGTGTCAAMAVLHAKGELAIGEAFEHEGILGTVFTGRLVEETQIGPHPAVVPTLSGQAWITGFAQYVLDPTDPFPEGFTLGDIWGGDDA